MVSNIGHEIGVLTIAFHDGAILVIEESGGLQEGCPVLDVSVVLKLFDRLLDAVVLADIGFIAEAIEMNAEVFELRFDFL